jgi:hypothetical protein
METVAWNNITQETLKDVLLHGTKEIKDSGCLLIPKALYEKVMDDLTDWQIEREAAERLRNDNGERISQEEAMARLGLTMDDLDGWEDVEIE